MLVGGRYVEILRYMYMYEAWHEEVQSVQIDHLLKTTELKKGLTVLTEPPGETVEAAALEGGNEIHADAAILTRILITLILLSG